MCQSGHVMTGNRCCLPFVQLLLVCSAGCSFALLEWCAMRWTYNADVGGKLLLLPERMALATAGSSRSLSSSPSCSASARSTCFHSFVLMATRSFYLFVLKIESPEPGTALSEPETNHKSGGSPDSSTGARDQATRFQDRTAGACIQTAPDFPAAASRREDLFFCNCNNQSRWVVRHLNNTCNGYYYARAKRFNLMCTTKHGQTRMPSTNLYSEPFARGDGTETICQAPSRSPVLLFQINM